MKIKEVELLNFGSLKTDSEVKEVKKDSPTGYCLYPTKVEFIEKTDRFQGLKGLKFGIEYFIKGDTSSEDDEVMFIPSWREYAA